MLFKRAPSYCLFVWSLHFIYCIVLSCIKSISFTGTQLTCGSGFQQPCVSGSSFTGILLLFFLFPLLFKHISDTRESELYIFASGSGKKKKVVVVITGAICGAFVLLLVGGVLMHHFLKQRKHKHEVFVDVEGIFPSLVSPILVS